MFGDWYDLKDKRLWMGVEHAAPGERVFMCTQDGVIFEKKKKTHDEDNKKMIQYVSSVSKDIILGRLIK
jgi:hypothetical protein